MELLRNFRGIALCTAALPRRATSAATQNATITIATLMAETATSVSTPGSIATQLPMDSLVLASSRMESATKPATLESVCLMEEIVKMAPISHAELNTTDTAVNTSETGSATRGAITALVVGMEVIVNRINHMNLLRELSTW